MQFDVIGPPLAQVGAMVGWREASGEVGSFTAAELARLNAPLDYEGGAETPERQGMLLAGEYTVTFDLSLHTLPEAADYAWVVVEPILHFITRSLASARSAGLAHDPVPSSIAPDKRVRLTRIIGGVHFLTDWPVGEPAQAVITVPTVIPIRAVRLGGRVYGQRTYWPECELD